MTKTEKIISLILDNGLCVNDLARAYWEITIDDYISCCVDFENLELKQEQYDKLVDNIMSDDEMWNGVDDTIDWYIRKEIYKGEENK